MSSGIPVFTGHHNTLESHTNLKHDRDLRASPCSRFVTSYHLITHRYVNVRSTDAEPAGSMVTCADGGKVIALPMVGGLHHRYTRRAA